MLPRLKKEEVNYSDFIAYFLNPKNNHALEDKFLKIFLQETINIYNDININEFPVHLIDILLTNLHDSKVIREFNLNDKGRPDIIILCESLKLAVIVEVKLFSKEGKNQTNNYYDGVGKYFDDLKYPLSSRIYIFLTPDGFEAENENFISLPYSALIEMFEILLKNENISDEVNYILLDFIDNVKGIIMRNDLIPLANDIYSQYGEIIDFIYKAGNNLLNSKDENWNETDFYYNIGECSYRDWDDYLKYGFISAGGGRKYSQPLKRLEPGNRIYAYYKGKGYLGVGIVKENAVPLLEYMYKDPNFSFDNLKAEKMNHDLHDRELSEWIVSVEWEKTREKNNPVFFKGIFANQNIVCKLTNKQKFTVEKLKKEFDINDAQQ
ncbi:MAG: PD-(D/E)XK nuclease family protein [Leptospiraceae bacterium]|nr:PD-(D/E)XK nuclease family protein [Leptospiraceae bacterium]